MRLLLHIQLLLQARQGCQSAAGERSCPLGAQPFSRLLSLLLDFPSQLVISLACKEPEASGLPLEGASEVAIVGWRRGVRLGPEKEPFRKGKDARTKPGNADRRMDFIRGHCKFVRQNDGSRWRLM